MNLHLDQRSEKAFAFYIDGDLQFDTLDEALYHESLALPALSLAALQKPNADLKVLICGGGDGLALRECLRFPHVAHVDLVDYSSEVVEWGKTRFADLNERAFTDPRAHVHIADAWEFLQNRVAQMESSTADAYDIILCDFTVPRREEDARVYSVEWYQLLRQVLGSDGLLALNALSPETTPEAFWCVNRTVRAAGLNPQSYRVCLPSFRAQGYGVWAFTLAGPRLRRNDLADLACPVPTRQYDMAALWPSAQFTIAERRMARRIGVHSLQSPRLLPLLLNPGMAPSKRQQTAYAQASGSAQEAGEVVALQGDSRAISIGDNVFPSATNTVPIPESNSTLAEPPYDLNALLAAIPISHPYHTRVMIESLAEQVIGTVA